MEQGILNASAQDDPQLKPAWPLEERSLLF